MNYSTSRQICNLVDYASQQVLQESRYLYFNYRKIFGQKLENWADQGVQSDKR